ncbi:MAG: TIGR04283 family arsenosugar biosynthesis glycosyltransferase [Kofleriaceae bacterium]
MAAPVSSSVPSSVRSEGCAREAAGGRLSSSLRGRLCVVAKAPRAGEVKTRLAAALGATEAAALARAFLLDTCAAARALPWADVEVALSGEVEPALAEELAVELTAQGGGDLGARLERVLRAALARAPVALAIGADSPGLPPRLLDDAHRALADGADAVLGPADDGGFYALGLRRCPPGLLAELPWSQPDTFTRTHQRLVERGLRVAVLEPWFDVDHPADLERLRALLLDGAVRAPRTHRALGGGGVSVVMPVLDEAARVRRALAWLLELRGVAEVIVVDGGSRDGTAELAAELPVSVLRAPRGRARQMNAGAAHAAGDVLWFVHADATPPADAVAHLRRALADPAVVAGAFRTWTVDDRGASRLAPLLHLADVRSRVTRLPYGDQAVFVRAEVFRELGGFPELPLMEDLELALRLRARGKISTVPARVRVSGRRFLARPLYYTAIVNLFPWLYRAGVSAERLARLYRAVR